MKEKRNNEGFRKKENEKRNKILKSNDNFRKKVNSRRNESWDKKRTKNYEEYKEKIKVSTRVSRKKQRDKDEQKFMENNRNLQRYARRNDTADQRLKAFLQGTIHNAVFICTCCHVRSFQSNVTEFTNLVQEKISSK